MLYDIYSAPDDKGVQKLIKKNLIKLKSITIEEIKSVEEMVDNKGKVIKSQCIIEYNNDKVCVVKHPYTEVNRLIQGVIGHGRIMGFRYKNKK